MALAAKTTKRTDELIASIRRRPVNLTDILSAARHHVENLRFDARLSYLDGRLERQRELLWEARRIERVINERREPRSEPWEPEDFTAPAA